MLAHHFERAGDWPEAIRYGRRAAERASALSQFADALATLDHVLEWLAHLPDGEARRDSRPTCCCSRSGSARRWACARRQQEIIDELIAHLAPRGPSARLAEAYSAAGRSAHAAEAIRRGRSGA